jgi:hypothetical protein
MAAVTAAETSMAVLVPELPARILLISTAGVVVAVLDRSELTAEVELIASTCSLRKSHKTTASLWIRIVHP